MPTVGKFLKFDLLLPISGESREVLNAQVQRCRNALRLDNRLAERS